MSAAVSSPEKAELRSGENGSVSLGAAAQRSPAPSRVEPLAEDAYKVTFTASRRLRDKIREAQDLLGHQVPSGDLAELVERGLDLLVEEVRKKRFGASRRPRPKKTKREDEKVSAAAAKESAAVEAKPESTEEPGGGCEKPRSRYIPAEVRRAVHGRDGERCTFVDERGRRCPATRRLELDHAEGFARGAHHTVESLRLRCRSHNQESAERMYGREFMEKKRAARSSAPARVQGSGMG